MSNPALLIGIKLHNALVYLILIRPKGAYHLNSAVAWQDNLFKPHIKKQFSAEKQLKQGDDFLIGLLVKQLGTGKQPTSCHAVMWFFFLIMDLAPCVGVVCINYNRDNSYPQTSPHPPAECCCFILPLLCLKLKNGSLQE